MRGTVLRQAEVGGGQGWLAGGSDTGRTRAGGHIEDGKGTYLVLSGRRVRGGRSPSWPCFETD